MKDSQFGSIMAMLCGIAGLASVSATSRVVFVLLMISWAIASLFASRKEDKNK